MKHYHPTADHFTDTIKKLGVPAFVIDLEYKNMGFVVCEMRDDMINEDGSLKTSITVAAFPTENMAEEYIQKTYGCNKIQVLHGIPDNAAELN